MGLWNLLKLLRLVWSLQGTSTLDTLDEAKTASWMPQSFHILLRYGIPSVTLSQFPSPSTLWFPLCTMGIIPVLTSYSCCKHLRGDMESTWDSACHRIPVPSLPAPEVHWPTTELGLKKQKVVHFYQKLLPFVLLLTLIEFIPWSWSFKSLPERTPWKSA